MMHAGVAVMEDSGAASMALFSPPQGGSDHGGGDEGGAKASNSDRAAGALVPATSAGGRRKPRGRPRGSKNKPKATVVVTRESEAAMRAVVLELQAGFDVLASVLGFARRRGVGVSVLSGCGGVSDVTLRHPACSSTLTFRGLFDILSLTGAFLPAAPRWSSPAASAARSHFTISLAGSQGELIGGVVEGPLVAAGTVRLMVATFASLEIQKLPPPQRGEEEEAGGVLVAAAGEGARQQPVMVAEPPSSLSTSAMQMVYNVGSVGGAVGSPAAVEAVPWSSNNPAVRGDGGTRFRNVPAAPSNQFHHRYY